MRVRLTGKILAAVFVVSPWFASALDAPHDRADTNTACHYCHDLVVTTAGGSKDFTSACISCHNRPGNGFGTPWLGSDEAVPGVSGNSHSWSKPIVNAQYQSKNVLSAADQILLVDGKLQCVVCHDPHTTAVAANPSTMHTSIPTGVPRVKTGTFGATTGTGMMTLTAPPGSKAKGFRIKIQTVGTGGGTVILTLDAGWNPNSWLNWSGTTWVAGTSTGPGYPFTDGAEIPIDAGVSVRFATGYVAGDYWDFFIGYPFLRFENQDDAWCYQCHQERVMNHVRARGLDTSYLPNGVRIFSHPVGITLNANGFGSDRAAVLDADGTAGSSATDGFGGVPNPTNDVVLKGGVVGCTSCHAVHNADSNSLTVDAH